MRKLYGDGIHDDTAAIQEQIDSGMCEITLPAPSRFYLISKPLELPSDFRLVLPRFAEVRLADGANCVMVRNKVVYDYAKRLDPEDYENPAREHLWSYVDDFSPNAPCHNIEICGGIWNCNNMAQIPNLTFSKDYSVREYAGFGMLFYNVTNLTLRNMTLKDPQRYAVTMGKVSYFTVENIDFDFNKGNPYPVNMDGIHLDGNCHYGVFRNLKGACYDDLIALNAREGSCGPITNIEIDGIFAEECHSAVRLLSAGQTVENIHISNVYGTYYQYCIGLSKHYHTSKDGHYGAISLDHLYVAKAMPARKGEFQHPKHTESVFPLVWVERNVEVDSLTVSEYHRCEKTLPKPSVHVSTDAVIKHLNLDNVTTVNQTGGSMPLLYNKGTIRHLSMRRIDCGKDEKVVNLGTIENADIQ